MEQPRSIMDAMALSESTSAATSATSSSLLPLKRPNVEQDQELPLKKQMNENDVSLRISNGILRSENRQLRNEIQTLETTQQQLQAQYAQTQQRLIDLEDDLAHIFRRHQKEVEERTIQHEEERQTLLDTIKQLEAKQQVLEAAAASNVHAVVLPSSVVSPQTADELNLFVDMCMTWQKNLQNLSSVLENKVSKLEEDEVKSVLCEVVSAVDVASTKEQVAIQEATYRVLQETVEKQAEHVREWLQTSRRERKEIEAFEAMERKVLEERVVELEHQVSQQMQQMKQHEAQFEAWKRQTNDEHLHAEKKWENEQNQLKATQQQLEAECATTKAQLQAEVDQHEATKQSLRDAQAKQETIQQQATEVQLTLRNELSEKQSQVESITSKLDATQAKCETLGQQEAEAQRQLQELTRQREQDRVDFEQQRQKLLDQLATLQQQLGSVAQDAAKANRSEAECKVLDQSLARLRDENQTLVATIATQENNLHDMMAKYTSALEAQATLRHELLQQTNENETLRQTHQLVPVDEWTQLQAERDQAKVQIDRLQHVETEYKHLTEAHDALQLTLKNQSDQLVQVQAQVQDLDQLQQQIDAFNLQFPCDQIAQVIMEKQAIEAFLRAYYAQAEAKCLALQTQVTQLHKVCSMYRSSAHESCELLRMCTQVDAKECFDFRIIRQTILDAISSLQHVA